VAAEAFIDNIGVMELTKRDLEKIMEKQAEKAVSKMRKESDERIQRYLGGLKEDFDRKLDTIMEYVKDTPAIKKLNITFDKVGEIAVDTEIIKEAVNNHERRLERLESR
jgi:hypothetical protein